jgi:hypothetical protein
MRLIIAITRLPACSLVLMVTSLFEAIPSLLSQRPKNAIFYASCQTFRILKIGADKKSTG